MKEENRERENADTEGWRGEYGGGANSYGTRNLVLTTLWTKYFPITSSLINVGYGGIS